MQRQHTPTGHQLHYGVTEPELLTSPSSVSFAVEIGHNRTEEERQCHLQTVVGDCGATLQARHTISSSTRAMQIDGCDNEPESWVHHDAGHEHINNWREALRRERQSTTAESSTSASPGGIGRSGPPKGVQKRVLKQHASEPEDVAGNLDEAFDAEEDKRRNDIMDCELISDEQYKRDQEYPSTTAPPPQESDAYWNRLEKMFYLQG